MLSTIKLLKQNIAVASILFALLLFSTQLAFAVPAEGVPATYQQPNGVTFEAVVLGDEWFNWVESDGYTIIQAPADDYWYYAVADSAERAIPSTLRVGIDSPVGIERGLRQRFDSAESPVPFGARMAPSVWPGVSGNHQVLVILVEFTPAQSLGTTAAQWNAAFFDNASGAKSVKNYYEEVSYGNFSIDPAAESQGTVDDGIIEVTLTTAHPNTGGSTGNANRELVRDALIAADGFIDYATFDADGSGGVDVNEMHLMVIPRGFEAAFSGACSPNVWGHRWSLSGSVPGPTLDGVRVGDFSWGGGYMQFGEWQGTTSGSCTNTSGNMATIGIMAHELGHDIAWPDLYDTDQSSAGVGRWSVMASGSWARASGEPSGTTPVHPDAFSKWYQNWLVPTLITDDTTGISLPDSATNTDVIQVVPNENGIDWEFRQSTGTGEYYLIENRQQIGFDAGLFRIGSTAQGCIIWHIDETRTSSNSNNNTEARKHVDVVEANSTQEMDASSSNRGDLDDLWPGTNGLTTFDASSTPNNILYDGTDPGFSITNIGVGSMGCEFDVLLEQPDLTITKSDSSLLVAAGSTTVYTLNYANNSTWVADDVVLAEVVPVGTTFSAVGSTAGWNCTPSNAAGSTCTLQIGTVAGNASGSADFALTADTAASGTTILNTATISGIGAVNAAVDADSSDNSDSDNDTVIQTLVVLAVGVSEMVVSAENPLLATGFMLLCIATLFVYVPKRKRRQR